MWTATHQSKKVKVSGQVVSSGQQWNRNSENFWFNKSVRKVMEKGSFGELLFFIPTG